MILPFLAAGAFVAFIWLRKPEGEHSPEETEYRTKETEAWAENMIVKGYKAGVETDIPVAPIGDGFYLRVDAAQAFKKMRDAAQSANVQLPVSTAFRSMAEQQNIYDELGPTVAARPGYSNHQSGVAIDLHGLDPRKANYNRLRDEWLTANCEDYGWKRTGLNFSNIEQWHLDYG